MLGYSDLPGLFFETDAEAMNFNNAVEHLWFNDVFCNDEEERLLCRHIDMVFARWEAPVHV